MMRTYCFRSCISISHSNDGDREKAHVHTVEVAAFVRSDEIVFDLHKYKEVENLFQQCLEPYQECYLNEMDGFGKDVSIEYLGEELFYRISDKLNEGTIYIERLEIGETPLRTYILTRTA